MIEDLRKRLWSELQSPGLLLIVGSSPAPNLIATLALLPRRIALFCSEATKPGVQRLLEAIRREAPDVETKKFGLNEFLVIDAFSAREIRRALESHIRELGSWVLFYTGGTKAMSTQVHSMWSGAGGEPERAFYLADRDGKLVSDGGIERSVLDTVELDIETLAKLHGLTRIACKDAALGPDASPGDRHVTAVLDAVYREVGTAERLRLAVSKDYEAVVDAIVPEAAGAATGDELRERLMSDAARGRLAQVVTAVGKSGKVKWKEVPDQWSRDLTPIVPGLPVALSRRLGKEAFKKWVAFAHGGWLEPCVATFVEQAGREAGGVRRTTHRNIKGFLPSDRQPCDPQFELDVAHVAGARLYAVSCTTEASESERARTKLKLFEVMERARQIGGDLARAAVVSLHENAVRDKLQEEIADVWVGDRQKPRVFGLSDLRAWYAGDPSDLVAWLRS